MRPCRNPESSKLRGFGRDESGANAVEFALIAPVLFLLLLGIIYSALYLGISHSLAQIAADTARYAMVGITQEERSQLADEWVRDSSGSYGLLKPHLIQLRTRESGGALEVAVDYDMAFLPQPPLLGQMAVFPERLSRTTTVLVP